MKFIGSAALGVAITATTVLMTGNAHAEIFQCMTTGVMGFEGTNSRDSQWLFGTDTGEDVNQGNAYAGENNLWVRDTSGWHSVSLVSNEGDGFYTPYECQMSAYVRTSSGVGYPNAWMEAYDYNTGVQLYSSYFGPETSYGYISSPTFFVQNTGTQGNIIIDFGLEGNGTDQWFQLDNVTLTCYCT